MLLKQGKRRKYIKDLIESKLCSCSSSSKEICFVSNWYQSYGEFQEYIAGANAAATTHEVKI